MIEIIFSSPPYSTPTFSLSHSLTLSLSLSLFLPLQNVTKIGREKKSHNEPQKPIYVKNAGKIMAMGV